jgi:hypothetical protein
MASAQSPQSDGHTEVQIGIINLIDRPVVLKLPAEQASLARMVERLRQPPDLIESIRVVGPAPDVRGPADAGGAVRSLRSGTVLIFPSHIDRRMAGLPSFPNPIIAAPHAASVDLTPPDTHHAESTSVAGDAPSAPRLPRNFRLATALRLTEGNPSPRRAGSRRSAGRVSPFRNVSPEIAERWQREEDDRAEGRAYFSFAVLGGIAVWAILVTVGSMGRRWIERSRARAAARLQASLPVPSLPEFSLGKRPHRPLRIDVNQPQTRLALDLAIFERALARHATATRDNPPSRAA